ncbi:Protein LCHN [Penicillium rolfsii]|nr:Protein LCHN [Penicillium rolfsii]
MASDTPRNPSTIDISRTSMESPPGIAALFVIRFDIRAGYVVSWKRTASGVEVEGVVEYKSLPSGLHNVHEDLIYFVHEQYAGISAFLNQPAEEAERNAKMFAIGVLVPLSSGRLGKSWRHAPKLKELTQKYATNMSDMQPLSDYWDSFRIGGPECSAPDSPIDSPLSLRFRPGDRPGTHRNRAFSDALVLENSRPALTPFHPASSLPDFIELFGPLIFPLYRAALLRKRILIMAEAPVHTPCNFVYDLSLLASLPNSLLQILPDDRIPPLRPRPLFNVGIHDIPDLASFDPSRATMDRETDPSWIACSTDTVLSMKPDLYDVLITLPPSYSQHANERVFPSISLVDRSSTKHNANQTVNLKATQRDARRYAMLRRGLRPFCHDRATSPDSGSSDADSTYSSCPVVEPLSWTRLAYTSFIWWASAGENRDGLSEEEEEHQIEQDARLLASVESLAYPTTNTARRSMNLESQGQESPEVALVAYFRRLTSQIFFTLAGAIARHDGDCGDANHSGESVVDTPYLDNLTNEDTDFSLSMSRQSFSGDDGTTPLLRQRSQGNHINRNSVQEAQGADEPITITIADMAEMGLDVWSATDRIFVEELVSLWWGRSAYVDSARIRCCGISIL